MQHVLQDLRVDVFEFRAFGFDLRQLSGLSIETNRDMVDAPSITPLLNGRVVKFAAQPKLAVKLQGLGLRRIQPVPESLTHRSALQYTAEGVDRATSVAQRLRSPGIISEA